MAELTPAQRAAAEAMIAGSHFKVDPSFSPLNPGPEVVFPSRDLTTRTVETVAVDPFTGSPIVAGQQGNTPAIRAAMDARGGPGAYMYAKGEATYSPPAYQPEGTVVADKRQERLDSPEYAFAYGPEAEENPAVAAIDGITVPMPRRRPNVTPTVYTADGDGGLYGVKMSPAMASILNTDPRYNSQRTGRMNSVPPPIGGNPQVAQVMASRPMPVNAQTAPYGPGTTFEQRAAAAARRESLMNPPTETNWAAIEASAKSRR